MIMSAEVMNGRISKYLMYLICGTLISGCATVPIQYTYRVITDKCNCQEFHRTDRKHKIDFHFRAQYVMNHGVVTTIGIKFINRSRDTLLLDLGMVKISSRNVSYQYNDKFIPLPHLGISPFSSDTLTLTGSDLSGQDDWNKIAGEQLTLTLQGMRVGSHMLAEQTVTFIPENPKL